MEMDSPPPRSLFLGKGGEKEAKMSVVGSGGYRSLERVSVLCPNLYVI